MYYVSPIDVSPRFQIRFSANSDRHALQIAAHIAHNHQTIPRYLLSHVSDNGSRSVAVVEDRGEPSPLTEPVELQIRWLDAPPESWS